MTISCYVLAAFEIHSPKSLKYQRYWSLDGLLKGIEQSVEKGADYISLRIIKVNEEAEG